MSADKKTVIAFDLYGTLLSTESIVDELATHFGKEKAESIAALWRRYQLEYTWRMNSMSLYKPFHEITNASLKHALAEHKLSLSEAETKRLMEAYDCLGSFPDVEPALKSLASDLYTEAYIFSNGTDAMVTTSIKRSPLLSLHAGVFKDLITVEEVGTFKPDMKVYQYLAKKVGCENEIGRVWLVSGNPFDIVGARVAGLQAAWVDRVGGHHGSGGWNDRLGELCGVQPTVIVKGVEEAVLAIEEWTSKL